MAVGGTTCGLEEEAVAFYPILVPIFLALGYDSIVCVGAIFLAASMGTTFSTINPFSVVIASNAAGIVFTEGILWRTFGLVVGTATVIGYLYWYCKRLKADPGFSYTYEDSAASRALPGRRLADRGRTPDAAPQADPHPVCRGVPADGVGGDGRRLVVPADGRLLPLHCDHHHVHLG